MFLFDCTLRDGANVIGKGFPEDLTKLMLKGMVENGIQYIEYGNALGVGQPDKGKQIAPLGDDEYMVLAQPYLDKATIGMFMLAKNATDDAVKECADKGLKFLRIGSNAGDTEFSKHAIETVKKYGLTAHYSLMKAYVETADELANEAKMLESFGLDGITIMDSAGTMIPDETTEYVDALKQKISIPVGFHGHNNMGFSVANAVAAYRAGADMLDCSLMGMARSAGNLATELALGVMNRLGVEVEGDFVGLLHFIEDELMPAMKHYYECPIKPVDAVFGYAGAHSSFEKSFKQVAMEENVDLFKLIIEVSKQNRKNPSVDLMKDIAKTL